ncbi:DUF4274 domain-containing protein [Tahibacter sp. P2K]|uniref:DUF4274 domain-containing protein n=1 Tax=Tahibacter harae TaxID=2963937 RepID=A0ABT1QVF3_9GAMM|nr:DUF4274 domain-containing protein [Tahibacter harae]MCQ4166258.1 DUF4274 domain-containing protein [Tahibacter harae]
MIGAPALHWPHAARYAALPRGAALNLDYDAQAGAVAALYCAEQLHRFSLRYNVNDGFEPLHAVVAHPHCDAGTALYLYWQFHELLADAQARADTALEPPRWNADAVLTAIEQRYPHGFRHHAVAYDPAALALDATGLAQIRAPHPGLPLLHPLRTGIAADTPH